MIVLDVLSRGALRPKDVESVVISGLENYIINSFIEWSGAVSRLRR